MSIYGQTKGTEFQSHTDLFCFISTHIKEF